MEEKLSFSYSLQTPKKPSSQILAKISFGYWFYDAKRGVVYEQVRCSPKVKVDVRDWDAKKHLPKSKEKLSEIAIFEETVSGIFRIMNDKKLEITPKSFKAEIDKKLKGTIEVDKMKIRIVDFIQDHIMIMKLAEGTKNMYDATRQRIEAFEKKIGKVLYASDVNLDIYKLYIEFIRDRDTISKNNTLVRNVENFIAALNKLAKHYKVQVFSPTKEVEKKDQLKRTNEQKVVLTFDEIITVIKHKPKNEVFKNIRLIFLTLYFTGVRYSDVFKVVPEFHYNEGSEEFDYCRFITKKNKKEVVIPILAPLADEFKKNGLPKYMKYNDFAYRIKTFIKDCGITRTEVLSFTNKNGEKEFEKKPFYQFVNSHIGRRSFITNFINYVPIPILCNITTHELKDKSVIFVYNQTPLLKNAALFIRHLLRATIDFKNAFPLKLVK